ncbi:hypothetical protein JTB14_003341 [Gonioctena quinquepunctata]|nr:hypothetical protein JTB14_003341 [Gonioctena quinquepunctata]
MAHALLGPYFSLAFFRSSWVGFVSSSTTAILKFMTDSWADKLVGQQIERNLTFITFPIYILIKVSPLQVVSPFHDSVDSNQFREWDFTRLRITKVSAITGDGTIKQLVLLFYWTVRTKLEKTC